MEMARVGEAAAQAGGADCPGAVVDLEQPTDLSALIFDGATDLLSEPEAYRIRQCEACVVHFFDTSRKGSRRWCSMNISGNKLKVAAYQRRKRDSEPAR